MTFTDGKYAQGVTIDSGDTLTYATGGNLNRAQGSIEFWIRPHWNGGDDQNYIFFEVGNDWFNRMRITKDGANNLRFILWDSVAEYGVAYHIAHWQAGEWHHIAATWIGSDIALYVDGDLRESSNTANPPDTLADTIYIGSSSSLENQANADIDEFRISAIPRIGNSDTCNYRILVADSGNNRIQAFDAQGNFVATYGSYGSGSDQLNNPQGLAVDDSGNIIVVDSGNNRLLYLSFDGFNFDPIRTMIANFNGPTGIASYGAHRIVVADTGNNLVKVLDAQGSLLAEYSAPNDGRKEDFNNPRGVVVDKITRIVVADTGNGRIVTIADALPELPSTIEVNIDIKPGSKQNTINLRSRGKIRVAILSSSDFDALKMVDRNSLTFGRTGLEVSLVSCKKYGWDVNRDGRSDLICDFSIRATGFQMSDTVGILNGMMITGIPISGQDSVRIKQSLPEDEDDDDRK